MATVYLEPQDLTPAQAARVLTLLNSATSAPALAAAIEIPGELDIGTRLAQRLLDARAALGGRFTELGQVRAVRLIGPERFTEICAAALGLDPRRWITQIGSFTDRQAELEARLARLAALADGTIAQREGARLDLTAQPQPLWLGQALDVRLVCTDAAGRPLPGRRVTVTTSTGTLEVAFGYAVTRAAGVAVRTGADGSARLTLRLTPPDGLTAEQQALLEGALDTLDPQAESAADLGPALAALAQVYTRERAGTLRAALDLYARQYRAVFVDRLNFGGAGVAFPLETSVLRADLHGADDGAGGAGGAASLAHAVRVAHHRNWVGAWLDALGEYVAGRAALDAAFGDAARRGATGQRLVDNLVAEAQVYIARLPGIAAQWAAQRRVDTAMQRYLARETANLDLPTRQGLFAQLTDAARQITPESRGTLAAVAQVKAELGTRIEQVGGISGALADEMRGLRTEVVARAEDVSRTAATVAQQAAQVQADRAAVSADRQRVDTRTAEFDTRYATFTTQYQDFNTRYQGFTVDYGSFQAEYTQFRTDAAAIDTRIAGAETDINRLEAQNATLGQRVNTLDAQTATLNQRVATLDTRTTTLNQQVGALDTRTTTLNQQVTTLSTQNTALTRDVSTLRTDMSRIPR